MNSKLRNMLVVAGVVTLGGVSYVLTTPQPATRTMAELRDAGITDGQRFVLTCPERLTQRTKRRIRDAQGVDALRPKQSYARVARVAVCFGDQLIDGGVGNCFRPSDWATLAPFVRERWEWRHTLTDGGVTEDGGTVLWLPELTAAADRRNDGGVFVRLGSEPVEPTIIVPSLRRDSVGLDPDGGEDSDGGEDAVDDSLQFRLDACTASRCADFDAGDGTNFCTRLNRLRMVAPPCVVPNCWVGDGGAWVDDAQVDCRFGGPFGTADGGARWRGCNTGPVEYSSGSACVPTECGVVAGDDAPEFL